MAVSTNVKVILDAQDNASSVLRGFGNTASKVAQDFSLDIKGAGIAATAFLGSLTALATGAVTVASSFEQNRVSFETMLGSADKAKKIMSELAKFTLETPFEMPQVVQGAKNLMAYGIEADKIIPTFKMLGDIAAGVGMDKLPNLVLAFGQVKAATKLTGMELRQFTEAGVPLLQALVDQANATGGVLTKVGGASKQTTKEMASLNKTIADANFRMGYLKNNGKENSQEFKNLAEKIKFTESKLASFGNVGSAHVAKVKVTTQEMIEAISKGEVTFDQVQKALAGLTGEGGKFQDLMLKQSKTFAGLFSNIKDKITQTMSEIAGVSVATGETKEGSIFAVLKEQAQNLYNAIDKVTPQIVKFSDALMKNKDALIVIAGALAGLVAVAAGAFIVTFGAAIATAAAFAAIGAGLALSIRLLIKGFQDGQPWVIALTAGLAGLAAVILAVVVPAFISLAASAVAAAIPIVIAFAPVFLVVAAIAAVIAALYLAWTKNWFGIQQIVANVVAWFTSTALPVIQQFFTGVGAGVQVVMNALGQFAGWLTGTALPAIQGFFTFIYNVIMLNVAIWQLYIALVQDLLTALFNWIWSWAGPILTAFFDFIKGALAQWVADWQANLIMWQQIITAVVSWFNTWVAPVLVAFFDFIKGQVANWVQSWQMWMSILQIAVKIVADWFMTYVYPTVKAALDAISNAIGWLVGQVQEKFNQIKSLVEGAINAIRNIIDGFKPKIDIGINLPNVEEAWKNLKQRAHNVGVPGFQTGGIVPGPIGAPIPIIAHGGEQVTPVGLGAAATSSGMTFNVQIGLYAGTETEKRNIARDLYAALVQVAHSQNKSVKELMGG